ERAHLPEAEEQQSGQHRRRYEAEVAERAKPAGPGGADGDDQRGGQAPEQRGEPAHQPAERTQEFGVGREVRQGEKAEGGRRKAEGKSGRGARDMISYSAFCILPSTFQKLR